ncbi:hypothetical protein SLS55_002787 [Diplodia seriata]|uniref:Uncharacterized protein n=1 Tax=Diplodia seriata TaxID=420778 RepID=A0ABR3CL49_9PEZI
MRIERSAERHLTLPKIPSVDADSLVPFTKETQKLTRTVHPVYGLASRRSPVQNCDQDSLVLQAVEGYDQFQRSHLPGRIRELLEAEFETNSDLVRLYERFIARLPDIIREGQRSLYETYRNFPRVVTPPNPSHVQPTFPENVAGYDILLDTEASAPPQPSVHTASPPAAFEAPPNTEYGMNLNEAQQVHSVSDR